MEYGIGVDIGGTRIKYSISDKTGQIVYHNTTDTEYQNKDQFLEKLTTVVEDGLHQSRLNDWKISGISVAFPGIVENGVVTGGAGNLPGVVPLSLVPFMKERFNLPVIAMNDAVGMAMGEHYYGAARNCTDAVFITIGTGIGGGIMVDGNFYNGFRDRGGELGHIIIERDGLPCSCGSRGCLEVYGSTSALVQYYKELSETESDIDGQQLFQKYIAGESDAEKAFDWHFRNIAIGLGSMINVFSPELIVLGGGIVNAGPQYLDGIRRYIADYTMDHLQNSVRVAPAKLGDSAASVGGIGHLFATLKLF